MSEAAGVSRSVYPSSKAAGSHYRREITIFSAGSLLTQLDLEASIAQGEAIVGGWGGVLVTRHDHHRFTIEVTSEVPFGLTLERDLAI